MRLLDSREVKNESEKEIERRRQRIDAMRREEKRASEKLNKARDAERAIDASQDRRSASALTEQKAILIDEVNALETRKAEALEPIEPIRKAAEDLLEENKKASAYIKNCIEGLEKQKENLTEQAEQILDDRQVLAERALDLDRREEGIAAAEEQLRISTANLSREWVKYHDSVFKSNSAFDEKSRELAAREKTVLALQEAMKKKEIDLYHRDIAIQDKFRELENSIAEFKKNKHGDRGSR